MARDSRQVRRILIVDDHSDNAESLRLLLEGRGHDVVVAASGASAIAYAATWYPDVVILDLGLPDIEGERVAAAMKGQTCSVPFVVAYSGYHLRERAALSAGCDAFVLKPNLDGLLEMAEHVAKMRPRVDAATERGR